MALTTTKLNNAETDCATLEQVVNGAASPGTLTSRLGRSLSTIAKLVADFVAALPKMKGTWSNSTAYVVGDLVSYGGSSYYAIQAGTNHLPTDTAYWTLSAQTGDISQARTQNNDWTGSNTFPAPTASGNPATKGYVDSMIYAFHALSDGTGFYGTPRGDVAGVTLSRIGVGHYRVNDPRFTANSIGVVSVASGYGYFNGDVYVFNSSGVAADLFSWVIIYR